MDSCTKDGALFVPGGGFRFAEIDSTEAHLSVSAQLSLSFMGLVCVRVCVGGEG